MIDCRASVSDGVQWGFTETAYNSRHSSLVTSRKSVERLRRWPTDGADFDTKKNSVSQEFRALPELMKPDAER